MFHAGGIASGPSGIRIWRCATDVPSFRDFATHYRLADIHKHTAEPRIGISRFVVDDSVSSTLRSRSRLVLICTTSVPSIMSVTPATLTTCLLPRLYNLTRLSGTSTCMQLGHVQTYVYDLTIPGGISMYTNQSRSHRFVLLHLISLSCDTRTLTQQLKTIARCAGMTANTRRYQYPK